MLIIIFYFFLQTGEIGESMTIQATHPNRQPILKMENCVKAAEKKQQALNNAIRVTQDIALGDVIAICVKNIK